MRVLCWTLGSLLLLVGATDAAARPQTDYDYTVDENEDKDQNGNGERTSPGSVKAERSQLRWLGF
ncbi:hypothetical protein IscW_ISCW016630 [Ixodes scapularis]|uniref:Secreted protein n=1 Tax=Ixodes scapularis TaxID=6945 RepID=B7PC11_IXOSC|nr:hypothetical protein IscW_ISCW016630 [Ixodes scapularis]|eukprot:XP_002409212.1 hypothetical protein IscW_ISCW016630 [Ixodes scapularis]